MSATSARTSRSPGTSSASTRPSRTVSAHSLGRISSGPDVAVWPASVRATHCERPGNPIRMPARATARSARTMRYAIVGYRARAWPPRRRGGLARERHRMTREEVGSAEAVDRATLGDRHEPSARQARHPFTRPALERRDQRVSREIFGAADVVRHAREAGDEAWKLDAPRRLDPNPQIVARFAQTGRACASNSTRSCSSLAICSGVVAGAKSAASNTRRMSISVRSNGARRIHAIASSRDATSISQ